MPDCEGPEGFTGAFPVPTTGVPGAAEDAGPDGAAAASVVSDAAGAAEGSRVEGSEAADAAGSGAGSAEGTTGAAGASVAAGAEVGT